MDTPAFNFEAGATRTCVGFDLVKIRGVVDSVAQFGERFRQRLFTPAELAYADAGMALWPERLAARFAAKEATIKALNLANAGISWREIEVQKLASGACQLALHGEVASIAAGMQVRQLCLSLSHDGDYAGAFVVAQLGAPQ